MSDPNSSGGFVHHVPVALPVTAAGVDPGIVSQIATLSVQAALAFFVTKDYSGGIAAIIKLATAVAGLVAAGKIDPAIMTQVQSLADSIAADVAAKNYSQIAVHAAMLIGLIGGLFAKP